MRGGVKVLSLSLSLSVAIFLACDQGDLGNTKAGQIVYRANYLPCGKALPVETEPLDQDPSYTFTGYDKDDALSLLDAGARMFDATTCRFTGMDPVIQPSMSSYAYASNNPINYVDPDGREPVSITVGAAYLLYLGIAATVATAVHDLSKGKQSSLRMGWNALLGLGSAFISAVGPSNRTEVIPVSPPLPALGGHGKKSVPKFPMTLTEPIAGPFPSTPPFSTTDAVTLPNTTQIIPSEYVPPFQLLSTKEIQGKGGELQAPPMDPRVLAQTRAEVAKELNHLTDQYQKIEKVIRADLEGKGMDSDAIRDALRNSYRLKTIREKSRILLGKL